MYIRTFHRNEAIYEKSKVKTYVKTFISKFEKLSGDAAFPDVIKQFLKR